MNPLDRLPFLGQCCEDAGEHLTRRGLLKSALAGGALLAGATALPGGSAAQGRVEKPKPLFSPDACKSLVPAATGGLVSPNPHVITVRWLGCSCFELVHRGKVYLLDAWYDRGPRMRSLGFTVDDIVSAEAIFVGHGHFDHVAEAPVVAARTGAIVAGAPITTGYVQSQGIPGAQLWTVTGRGGERMDFDGFTVEAILAHHAVAPSRRNSKGETIGQAIADVYAAALDPYTPEEEAQLAAVLARGSFDPRIITEGTIAYLFTFETGFRFVWVDSGGPITPELRAMMDRIGKTNLAIASYTLQGIPRLQVPVTMALLDLVQPDLFLPCHHDELVAGSLGAVPDMGTEPLRLAIRDTRPNTRAITPLYRTPLCVDTRNGRYSVAL